MLKQRIITAAILLPLIIAAILLLPTPAFSIVALLPLLVIGGFEWARLARLEQLQWQLAYVGVLLLIAGLIYLFQDALHSTVLLVALACQVIIFTALAVYQQGGSFYQNNRIVFILLGFIVLPAAWWLLTVLHASSSYWVLFLILLTVIADTAAYFSGRAFGKTKLAPELSPGKTQAGMYGALLGGFIWSLLGIWFFNIDKTYWLYFVLLNLIVVIASISGDLFISMMKREADMKDSGQLLPGHGGILDRIDSLLAAVVVLTAGLVWSGLAVN